MLLLFGQNLGLLGGAGPAPGDEDNYATSFLGAAEAVPAGAAFRDGAAYNALTGERYVALWPADDVVFYLSGFAHRPDGALCIAPSGTEFMDLLGISVTLRGEVITSLSAAEIVHNGLPLRYDGSLCVTEES